MTVRLGEHDYSTPFEGSIHQDIPVSTIEIFPEYDPNSDYHDIALFKLSRPIESTVS